MENLNNIIDKLKQSFKSEKIKESVLDDNWLIINRENKIDSTGFCYYAHEVIYRLTGGRENWKFMRIPEEDFPSFGPYYFLKSKKDNSVLDITADQCSKLSIKIPYEKGKGKGLQKTSNKAKILANEIGEKLFV